MFKKPSIKLRMLGIVIFRYLEKISWTIAVVIVLFGVMFLYNNWYKALNNISLVTLLKSQVAVKIVDINLWEEINKEIEWKKQPVEDIENINNPF